MAEPVAVVGAGIAGLTTALALAGRGHAVTVIERRTAFSEIGAGIQLSPNASAILAELGLGPALRRVACEPDRILVRALGSARPIGAIALGAGMRQRFGAPYLVARRADLQTILLDAVRSQPQLRLLMGRTVTQAGAARGGVAGLEMRTSGGTASRLEAGLIVGADGLWSSLRESLGDARMPRHRGYAAWRALLPTGAAPPALAGNETGLWLGRNAHVVHYPVEAGRQINLVVVGRRAEPVADWDRPGAAAEVAAVLDDAAPVLRDLAAAAGSWVVRSLYDLPAWRLTGSRLALVGDAAHPVLPFLAQGGALAIEDAAVLARCWGDGCGPADAALAAYERSRLQRVRRVQNAARANARRFHLSGPFALMRDAVIQQLGPEAMARRYAWLYGWRPPQAA